MQVDEAEVARAEHDDVVASETSFFAALFAFGAPVASFIACPTIALLLVAAGDRGDRRRSRASARRARRARSRSAA